MKLSAIQRVSESPHGVIVTSGHECEEDQATAGELNVGMALDPVGGENMYVCFTVFTVGILGRVTLVTSEVKAEAVEDCQPS